MEPSFYSKSSKNCMEPSFCIEPSIVFNMEPCFYMEPKVDKKAIPDCENSPNETKSIFPIAFIGLKVFTQIFSLNIVPKNC